MNNKIGVTVIAEKILSMAKNQRVNSLGQHLMLEGFDLVKKHRENPEDPENEERMNNWLVSKAMSEIAIHVFSFSVLEASLSKIIELLFQYDPSLFDVLIADRQVSYSDACSMSSDELREQLFKKFAENYDFAPIKKKVDVLMGILQPSSIHDVVKDYQLDVKLLKEASDRRNKFTHHAELKDYMEVDPQTYKDILYMQQTSQFFFELLERYVYD